MKAIRAVTICMIVRALSSMSLSIFAVPLDPSAQDSPVLDGEDAVFHWSEKLMCLNSSKVFLITTPARENPANNSGSLTTSTGIFSVLQSVKEQPF